MPFRPITGAELETLVRDETLHESDTQVTSVQIQARLGHEYARAVRLIASVAPELVTEEDTVTLAAGSRLLKSSLTPTRVDSQYDSLVKIEQQLGTRWEVLGRASKSDDLLVAPSVPRTYRITYLIGVSFDNTVDPANTGTARKYYLPDGMQAMIAHRVAAWARQRQDDSYTFNRDEAMRIQEEVLSSISNTSLDVPVCGLAYAGDDFGPKSYPSILYREFADGWELYQGTY